MVRKLAAALLGVGVLIPGLANALGLGEIKLNSALSEPLNAEIELVQVRELTATEILPTLATLEDFRAAGVERSQMLGDLKFDVVVGDRGRSYIKVTSRKPIKEPFLNFLVEVNWPAGRLLREYTMLLDPPLYSGKKAEPVRQAQAALASTPARTAAPAPRPTPTAQAAPASRAPAPAAQPYRPEPAGGADSHTIGSNDSLWSIAQKLRPSNSVTMQQTMIALQRHNPDAFIDGNINLLRRGAVLRAPSEAEAKEVTSREAIELVAEQNRLWRDRVAGKKSSARPEARQVDASGRTPETAPAPVEPSEAGRLKLLSGTATGTAESGQGGSEGGKGELRNKLALAEENIDKFKLENDDLKVKMSDLQTQIQTSEKVISLKDQQIATLQAKLAEMERQQAAAAEAAGKAVPVPQIPAEAAPAEAAAVTPASPDVVAPEITAAEPEVTPVSPEVDFNYEEPAATTTPESASTSAPETAAAGTTPELPAEPATSSPETASVTPSASEPPAPGLVMEEEAEPVVQQATPEQIQPVAEPAQPAAPALQQDLLTQLMSNPLYLGIGGGAIVLLLLAGLLAAKRKKETESGELAEDEQFQLPETRNDLQDDMAIDLPEAEEALHQDEAPAEPTVPQTADVLGEADIYIAYGRYPQAIEMLQKAAEKEPDRADIRMKLCEVSAEARQPETFMTHYRALQVLGATALLAKADQLRAKIAPDAAGTVDADIAEADAIDTDTDIETDAEVDFERAFASEATSVPGEDNESFDFDISEDVDATLLAPAAADEQVPVLEQEADSGLDFDLADLEDTGVNFTSGEDDNTKAEVASTDEGLDFDLSFDSDEPLVKPAEPVRHDNSLDFDLDLAGPLDTAEEPVARQDDSHAPLEFDAEFSLDDVDAGSAAKPAETQFDADLTLDFDQMETAPAAPVAEDTSLDFDLDFDIEAPAAEAAPAVASDDETGHFEIETDDQTIAFTPPAAQPAAAEEAPLLDSEAAALLADELDFDVTSEAPALPVSEPPADEDATVLAAPVASTPPVASTQPAANDFSVNVDDELDFLSDADESATKLDLARAYIDMGDRDGARDILDEVMIEGSDSQKQEAKDLLLRLES